MTKIPPPIWTVVALALCGVISALYPWRTLIDLRRAPLGIGLIVFGALSAIWAFVLFFHAGTEIRPDSKTNKALVASGIYRLTRNPMYLGLVLISLGAAFWIGDLPMFAAPIIVFAVCSAVHIPMEEAKMRAQFGQAFDAYARKVRRWV